MPEDRKTYRAVGLMSGTSLDGIDAALLRTDGEGHIVREAFVSLPYDDGLRARVRACFNLPPEELHRAAEVERELTAAHARVVGLLLEQAGLDAAAIDVIGFHGQTVSHAPERGYTCQIGDGALLAAMTGIPVVNDFRTADVKAGGQGAPLVPVYHLALAACMDKPVAFLNIGGVANVTYVGRDGGIIAFDTGAGNALIDDWMLKNSGKNFDAGGKTAARGSTKLDILEGLLSHAFFDAAPPKSLDRNAFDVSSVSGLSPEDGAATLTDFTVEGVVRALDHLPENPRRWIVAGGGRHNETIMQKLADRLGAEVVPIEAAGLDGDATEAEAFAYLAVRSLRGLPISFPTTTGVPRPMTGGRLHAPMPKP